MRRSSESVPGSPGRSPYTSAVWRTGHTPRQATRVPSKAGEGIAAVAVNTCIAAARPSASARLRSVAAGPEREAAMTGTGLPAALWDERLSSAAVSRVLIGEADMTRKRNGEVVDRMATAWMLQPVLDASRLPGRP